MGARVNTGIAGVKTTDGNWCEEFYKYRESIKVDCDSWI